MPGVLIVTPTYSDLLRPETVAAIKALQFEGRVQWEVIDCNPYPAPDMRNVLAAYRHAHALFMAGDYDAMLTVEQDMIPPPHALQALWDAGKPVAYGVYLLRHGVKVLNAYEYSGNRNMGESLSIARGARVAPDTGLIRVSGVGFGCTLIRRAVLEQIAFHGGKDGNQSPDVPFASDCLHAGIGQWASFDVLCGHFEGGKVLMPFADSVLRMCKVTANATMNVLIGGQSTRILGGRGYSLPQDAAFELARAGYVELVEPAGSGLSADTSDIETDTETDIAPRRTGSKSTSKRQAKGGVL